MLHFWNLDKVLKIFSKKLTLINFLFFKLLTSKTWLDEYKSPVSEDRSTSNIVNVPKHCWNLYHSTFIIFIFHWKGNSLRKSLSYWYTKSWDCLLTHWLQMKSILFLIEKIQPYQFRCNYLRNKKFFLNFLLHFPNLDEILNILKKRMILTDFLFSKCIFYCNWFIVS